MIDFHVLIFLEKVGRVVTCDELCSVTVIKVLALFSGFRFFCKPVALEQLNICCWNSTQAVTTFGQEGVSAQKKLFFFFWV